MLKIKNLELWSLSGGPADRLDAYSEQHPASEFDALNWFLRVQAEDPRTNKSSWRALENVA